MRFPWGCTNKCTINILHLKYVSLKYIEFLTHKKATKVFGGKSEQKSMITNLFLSKFSNCFQSFDVPAKKINDVQM